MNYSYLNDRLKLKQFIKDNIIELINIFPNLSELDFFRILSEIKYGNAKKPNGNGKLTYYNILDIIVSINSLSQLAKEFSCDISAILKIKQRKIYTEITYDLPIYYNGKLNVP